MRWQTDQCITMVIGQMALQRSCASAISINIIWQTYQWSIGTATNLCISIHQAWGASIIANSRPTKSWYLDNNHWELKTIILWIYRLSEWSVQQQLFAQTTGYWKNLWPPVVLYCCLLFDVKHFELILSSPGLFLARTSVYLFIINSHKLKFASHIIGS